MRVIKIDPYTKAVTRLYVEKEDGIINHLVGSSEPMTFELGQRHRLWLDSNWAIRMNQQFFGMVGAENGVLGGYAIITEWDHESQEIDNCAMPVEGVEKQFFWVDYADAILNPVVSNFRINAKNGLVPREVIHKASKSVH